ncbi:MAG: hypothetical protein V1929_01540 [bacterium]
MLTAPIIERLPPGTARCLRCHRLHDVAANTLPERTELSGETFRIDGLDAVRLRCPFCSITYEFLHSAPHEGVQIPEQPDRDELRRRREEAERRLGDEVTRLRRKIEERLRQEEEELALRRADIERRRKQQEEEELRREDALKRRREDETRRAEEEHRRKEEATRLQREAEQRGHAEMEIRRLEQERKEDEKRHVHAIQKRSLELLQRLQMEEDTLKRTVIQIVSVQEFKFGCPYCSRHIQVGVDLAGREVDCPSCRQHVHVPEKGMAGMLA